MITADGSAGEKQPASPSGEGDIFAENLQGGPVMDTGNGGIWHLQSGSQMIEGEDGGDGSVGYAVNSIHNLEGSDATEDQGTMSDGVLKSEIASSSTESTTFADGLSSCIADHARDLNLNLLLDENGNQLRHVEGNVEFIDASHGSWIDSLDEKFGSGDALVKNSLEILEPENDIDRSMGVQLMNTDVFSHDMISLKSDDWHYPEFHTEFSNDHSAMQFGMNEYDAHYTDSPQCNFSSPFNFGSLHNNQENIDFQPESACSGSEISMTTYSDINRMNVKYEGIDYMSPISGKLFITC
ncbi:hypothetical protein OIU85_022917 [Salix viminalis]|uniref:Uncharacterized protein n=1 Tax=Salix viminalis TaxID=40686 RepID=A0A9Q0Z858_SALVM|nr:hypothetical protein OIU85_022917 [Salix viminalis]